MTFPGSFRRFRIRSFILRCARSVSEVFKIVVKYSFIIFIKMLEACLTYETGILDRQGFEVTNDPVWILGRQYDTKTSKDFAPTCFFCCFVLFYRFIKTECLIMYRHGRAYCRCQIQTLVDLPPELSPHRLFWNDNRQRLGLHVEMWANGYCASLDQLSSGYVTVVYCLSSNTIILFL